MRFICILVSFGAVCRAVLEDRRTSVLLVVFNNESASSGKGTTAQATNASWVVVKI